MPDPIAFLTQPAGRGATVIVVGAAEPALCVPLAAATGATGLLVTVAAVPGGPCPGIPLLRAAPMAVPVLSHVADLVVLTTVPADADADAVAEEARRVLAPGGVLRAVALPAAAYRLVGALHAAAFRDVEAVQLGSVTGVRARGPR